MCPFIDCKYESIYNVLVNFGKETNFFNKLYYFKLEENNNILVNKNMSKLLFSDFLSLFFIKEKTINKTNNLLELIKKETKLGNYIVIKTDLYYQKFSNNYFEKKHKKHNVFIKGINKGVVNIIENEFADSKKYIDMSVKIDELESWYYGYIDNYYNTNMDLGDTIAIYINDYSNICNVNMYWELLSNRKEIATLKHNINILNKYKTKKVKQKEQMISYTNILHYKIIDKERNEIYNNVDILNIINMQITLINQIRRNISKEKKYLDLLNNYIRLEKELINILLKQEINYRYILRYKNKFKICNDMRKYTSNIERINILNYKTIIIDIKEQESYMRHITKIRIDSLIKMTSCGKKTYNSDLILNDSNIIKSLKDNNCEVEHINVQRNSINGYSKGDINKYFFKILNVYQAEDELRGYIQIYGKIKVAKLRDIIIYNNAYILLFNYDNSIQKDEGLLNDFFVKREIDNKIYNQDFNKINTIIKEYLSNINDVLEEKHYPMEKFFENRIDERLIKWYKNNIIIIFNKNRYELENIINNTVNYFKTHKQKECFLSQGDPNVLNIGEKPIFFDYPTSGYNTIDAELSTIIWSILFNDLYFAPKYHKESYYNHEKLFKNINKYTPIIDYKIDKTMKYIEVTSCELKTSKIRKMFIIHVLDYLAMKNNIHISEDIIYNLIMRILCIFNLNEMEEQDMVYSLCLMCSLIEIIEKNNNKERGIREFIENLEVI